LQGFWISLVLRASNSCHHPILWNPEDLMNPLQPVLAGLIFACLLSFSVRSQSPPPPPAPSETERQQQQEREIEAQTQKTLAMLDELIESGRSLRLPENQALVFSTAADLLWPHDEKRARELFGEAIALVTALLNTPEEKLGPQPENVRWQTWELRRRLVSKLTPHDPQLAGEFLLASLPPANKQEPPFNAEIETHLEMAIARQLAAKDPLRQLQYAEEMLAAGKPPNHLSGILYALRDKNLDAARKLADLIVAKLEAETPLSYNSAQFALQLVQFAPQPDAREENPALRRYLLSAEQARRLLEKSLAAAQAELRAARQHQTSQHQHQAQGLFSQLRQYAPYLEKHLPSALAAYKTGLAEVEQSRPPHQRAYETLNKVAENGSVDAVLAAAAQAPTEVRHQYFQRAASLAQQQGQPDRARQILTTNIADKQQQRYALQNLDRQLLQRKIQEQKFDEARQMVAKERNLNNRLHSLVSMAQTAQNAGKKDMALEFLAEAGSLVAGPAESNEQFHGQLQVAGAYLRVDSTRSFDLLDSTTENFNDLFAAMVVVDSFEQRGTFRNKEMILQHGGGQGMNYLQQYAQLLAQLAVADSDRVQAMIARFARADARAHLRLTLVQQFATRLQAIQRPMLRRNAGRNEQKQ
jgi:hypothetical protein